jgi:hypothetical protein
MDKLSTRSRFVYLSSTSILAIAFISITFHVLAQAQPIPKGFQEILQESGVQVYQKDYSSSGNEKTVNVGLRFAPPNLQDFTIWCDRAIVFICLWLYNQIKI